MAPPAAGGGDGGGGAGGGRQQQQQQAGFGQTIAGVVRMAIFWYFASKFFFSPKKPADSTPAIQMSNLFHKGEPLVCFISLV